LKDAILLRITSGGEKFKVRFNVPESIVCSYLVILEVPKSEIFILFSESIKIFYGFKSP
jgi:hypothetical protein